MKDLKKTERIDILKDKMLAEPRYASIEQAWKNRICQKRHSISVGFPLSLEKASCYSFQF